MPLKIDCVKLCCGKNIIIIQSGIRPIEQSLIIIIHTLPKSHDPKKKACDPRGLISVDLGIF